MSAIWLNDPTSSGYWDQLWYMEPLDLVVLRVKKQYWVSRDTGPYGIEYDTGPYKTLKAAQTTAEMLAAMENGHDDT